MKPILLRVEYEFTTDHTKGNAAACTPPDRRLQTSMVVFSDADRLTHLGFNPTCHSSKGEDNALCCPIYGVVVH